MLDINFKNAITIALLSAVSLAALNWFASTRGLDIDLDDDDGKPMVHAYAKRR